MGKVLGGVVLAIVGCGYDRPADVPGPISDNDACVGSCIPAVCGDAFLYVGVEECDNGSSNSNSGTCLLSCHLATCGDGHLHAEDEVCDDGNSTCGACNSTCTMFASARATGTIRVVSSTSIIDGETFTLNDGINLPVTFEFVKDGILNVPEYVPIDIGMASHLTLVRNITSEAINSVGVVGVPAQSLLITATTSGANGSIVTLRHDRFTRLGNVEITYAVTDISFEVAGMDGGAGGDCATGQSCRSDADCVSNICTANVCQ